MTRGRRRGERSRRAILQDLLTDWVPSRSHDLTRPLDDNHLGMQRWATGDTLAFNNQAVNEPWLKPFSDPDRTYQNQLLWDHQGGQHPAVTVHTAGDPHLDLMQIMGRSDRAHQLLLGVTPTDFALSAPRRNVAFLGAPRANKSASVVTTAASYLGPLLTVTTRRFEFAQAVGHARARIAGNHAELVHIDLDGAPALPGWSSRGWTPVTTDVRTAYSRAKAMAESMDMGTSSNGGFWSVQATAVLYPLLLAAGLGDLGIEWVHKAVQSASDELMDQAVFLLNEAHKRGVPGMMQALESLEALATMAPETKGGVLATASGALSVYSLPDAVAATKRPLVDLEALVAGMKDEPNELFRDGSGKASLTGCFGTVLVTGSSAQQRLLRPIVVGIAADLRDICFRLADKDNEDGVVNRRSTLAILDDMPTLAPDRDLPATLAQSGGQNLLICGIYHDDAQLRTQWGEDGKNMATTFGEQVAYRGIRDTETLERITTLTGQRFVNIRGQSSSTSRGGKSGNSFSESLSITPTLLAELTPAMVNQGHPDDPNIVLSLHPASWEWMWSTPYYEFPMWVKLMVTNIGILGGLPPQRLHLLAPPDLARGNDLSRIYDAGGANGAAFVQYYETSRAAFLSRAEEYRSIKKHWVKHPALDDYDDCLAPQPAPPTANRWLFLRKSMTPDNLHAAIKLLGTWTPSASSSARPPTAGRPVETGHLQTPGVEPIYIAVWNQAPIWDEALYKNLVAQLGDKVPFAIEIKAQDRPGEAVAAYLSNSLALEYAPAHVAPGDGSLVFVPQAKKTGDQ